MVHLHPRMQDETRSILLIVYWRPRRDLSPRYRRESVSGVEIGVTELAGIALSVVECLRNAGVLGLLASGSAGKTSTVLG